VFVLTYHCTS